MSPASNVRWSDSKRNCKRRNQRYFGWDVLPSMRRASHPVSGIRLAGRLSRDSGGRCAQHHSQNARRQRKESNSAGHRRLLDIL